MNDGSDGVDKTSDDTPTPSTNTNTLDNTNSNDTSNTSNDTNTNANINTNTNNNTNETENANANNNTSEVSNTNTNENSNISEGMNGELKESESTPGYADVRTDREPRLEYIVSKDYLYIEIRDMAGIACAYPTVDGDIRYEAQKELEPQVYHFDNDKRGEKVDIKRPTEADYQKYGKVFKYRVGIPVTEFSEEYKKFEVVAYDVTSKTKQQFNIDEVFMVKKSADGSVTVNRAPTSNIVLLRNNWNQMSMHAMDATGISVLELRTLPKSKGKPFDCIRSWSGKNQSHWSAVTFITSNGKYVQDGLTKFEKIDSIFKPATNWVGLNPKVEGKDGIYIVSVAAADASGARSVKTMAININYYISDDKYEETGNGNTNSIDSSNNNNTNNTNNTKSSERENTTKEVKEPENQTVTNTTENTGNTTENSLENTTENKTGNSTEVNQEENVENEIENDLENEMDVNSDYNPDDDSESSSETSEDNSVNSNSNTTSSNSDNNVDEVSNTSVDVSAKSSEKMLTSDTLKRGSKGIPVGILQKRLSHMGYFKLSVNSTFDAQTERVIRDFQKINGLTESGIVDSETIALINSKKYKAPKDKDYNGTYAYNLRDPKNIKAIQRRLNDLGYGKLNVTGVMDDATKKALNTFAKNNGVTLKIEKNLLQALNSEDAKKFQ